MEREKQSSRDVDDSNKAQKRMKKVLMAIDESAGSFHALKWALQNLFLQIQDKEREEEEEKSLVLVHVHQPFQPYMVSAGPAIYATPAAVESVRNAQEQNSSLVIGRALEICRVKAIKVETLILQGDPKDMICDAVEQTHANLLVVGSRGLGMIERAFLGSVSDYCAHHAKCPILIVKPPK